MKRSRPRMLSFSTPKLHGRVSDNAGPWHVRWYWFDRSIWLEPNKISNSDTNGRKLIEYLALCSMVNEVKCFCQVQEDSSTELPWSILHTFSISSAKLESIKVYLQSQASWLETKLLYSKNIVFVQVFMELNVNGLFQKLAESRKHRNRTQHAKNWPRPWEGGGGFSHVWAI